MQGGTCMASLGWQQHLIVSNVFQLLWGSPGGHPESPQVPACPVPSSTPCDLPHHRETPQNEARNGGSPRPCSPQHQEMLAHPQRHSRAKPPPRTSAMPPLPQPPCPDRGNTPVGHLDPLGEAPNLLFQPDLGQTPRFSAKPWHPGHSLATVGAPRRQPRGAHPHPGHLTPPSHRWGCCYSFLNNKPHFSEVNYGSSSPIKPAGLGMETPNKLLPSGTGNGVWGPGWCWRHPGGCQWWGQPWQDLGGTSSPPGDTSRPTGGGGQGAALGIQLDVTPG